MRKLSVVSLLAASTAFADPGNGGMVEVNTYEGAKPHLDRYKAIAGEQLVDAAGQAAAWMPGINGKPQGDFVDVVLVHAGHKLQLAFVPEHGKRSLLPVSLDVDDLDVVATSFAERPKHELLIWARGLRDAPSEAYLVSWDAAKHAPVVDKHWTGPAHQIPPAWSKPD